MQKSAFIISFLLFIITANCQKQEKTTTYFFVQVNPTIYSKIITDNPWSIGFGIQSFFNNRSKFKPIIELTADVFLENDRIFRTNPDGSEKVGLKNMINLFVGTSFHPTKYIFLSMTGGPSFTNQQTLFGIKPTFGFYFSANKKWLGKLSFINIFRNNKTTNDFGAISLAIGTKLF